MIFIAYECFEFSSNVEHDIFFVATIAPDGTGVFTTMSWINGHCERSARMIG